ncbi:MAG: membrane protein insertase YidC [Salinivirgaceae bacterium]
MDKNSWLGLALIVSVLFLWSYLTKPTQQEIADRQRVQDSLMMAQRDRSQKEIALKEEMKSSPVISESGEKSDSEIQNEMTQLLGDFAPFSQGERKFYTVENNLIKLQFLNQGGRIYSVELKKYKKFDGSPLVLFSGDSVEFGLNFFAQNRSITTNQLFFTLEKGDSNLVVDNQPIDLVFSLPLADGKFIQYHYTISPDSYAIKFDINFSGMEKLIATNTGDISLGWKSYISALEKGKSWESTNATIIYKFNEADVDKLSETKDQVQENLNTPIKWISYKQQFFNATLIADNSFNNATVKAEKELSNPEYLKQFSSEISLPYQGKATESIPMSFYFGPNHYKTLKKLDVDLEEVITLGSNIIRWINVGVVIPLFNWLGKYIGNYGIIILLVTIIIKIVLFPFTYKSYLSTAKMKALKPEVDKLAEKFPKSEDAMKKQQATMALYKKVGVSPLGGCLPLLFQMPILLAMFRFFPNSIELRQESFLWADDLSTYDAVINLPFTIPMGFGSHISLFCLLMTIVNVVYLMYNDQMSMSNQNIPGMKLMMYMMPVMMLFWFNSYAAALSYYYFLSLLITIIQTWLMRRAVNDEEILAKLKAAQANKKIAPKSKWQQRLEDMAKQRGIQAPKR